jgi:hypothetical protein
MPYTPWSVSIFSVTKLRPGEVTMTRADWIFMGLVPGLVWLCYGIILDQFDLACQSAFNWSGHFARTRFCGDSDERQRPAPIGFIRIWPAA